MHVALAYHHQGHVKSKVDGLLSTAKRRGVAVVDEFASFVNDQIYALKEVVEREGLDCEFELRRSYDVFLDDLEAEDVKSQFLVSLAAGHKWTRDRWLIDEKMVEQVRVIDLRWIRLTVGPGNFVERRQGSSKHTGLLILAVQVCFPAPRQIGSPRRGQSPDQHSGDRRKAGRRRLQQRHRDASWIATGS